MKEKFVSDVDAFLLLDNEKDIMVNSLFILALRSSSGRETFMEPNNRAGTLPTISHLVFKVII